MPEIRKAVVTVLGIDRKGIIARISAVLYDHNVNIFGHFPNRYGRLFSHDPHCRHHGLRF